MHTCYDNDERQQRQTSLTKEAAADGGAVADTLVGVVEGSELRVLLGGLGSGGSELSLCPDKEDTSTGWLEAEEGGGEEPLRLADEGGLARLQGTKGGGELPVEGNDPELRSSRSVTDTDSSPGLQGRKGDAECVAPCGHRLIRQTAPLLCGHLQQAVHVLGGWRDVVVVLAGESQFGAVTLVDDVPQLFGRQRLKKTKQTKKKPPHTREGK